MQTETENLSYDELSEQNSYLLAKLKSTKEQLQDKDEQLQDKKEEISKLWKQLLLLKKHIFGRRSEKLSVVEERQEVLFPEEVPEIVPSEDTVQIPAHKRHKRGRKPLPKDLPRERIEYEPEQQRCNCCGEQMPKIGEEVTEELDYIPARFVIREHVKIKRACSKCKRGVVIGKLPPEVQVIEGGRAGAGLLTHIMLSKYNDHLPLNRQEQIFLRHGFELPRQRMCDWIGSISEQLLMPIAEALKKEILKSRYIQADETTQKVQTKEKEGKLHTGYLWGMLSLEGDVYFEYNQSRAGEVARELFSGSSALIQTDLYAGYNPVFDPEGATRVGCWAHVRRKFVEAEACSGKDCMKILTAIAELYKIERKAKNLLYHERKELRQRKSKPILDKLKLSLEDLHQRVLPKSALGAAISYALCQWKALTLFLNHGELEIDNNGIERQMRPIAIGRHNWLFAGSTRGAKWAACIFSLIGTCKLNKINTFDYFTDILRRGATHPASRIIELTPQHWKKTSSS